ncbi:MAG: hypothetical protein K940chlam2_01500, partial [Chlamydiae bacterium]|nr:hypothetical protein [Chlamydiota bacterium]
PAVPAWTLGGEAVFPVPFPENESSELPMRGTKEAPLETVHIIRGLLAQHPELAQAARIPVEEITCPVLLVSGGRDGLWPSGDFCHEMMPFLQRGEHLHFPDAGHAIGVPNLPTAQCFYMRRADLWLSMGGSAARSQGASVFSWEAMNVFFSMFLERSTF